MLPRHQLHQVLFDFLRIGLARDPEAMREPRDMRIDDDSFIFSEGVAENYIRRFPSDTGQGV